MLFALLAALVAAASATVAWKGPLALARLRAADGAALTKGLRGMPPAQRAQALGDGAAPRWLQDLANALRDAASDRERSAAVNEALSAFEHELSRASAVPQRMRWICIAGSTLCILAGWLGGARHDLLWIVPACATGIALCAAAGAKSRREGAKQRAGVATVAETLLADLDLGPSPLPERHRMRWQRRHRL